LLVPASRRSASCRAASTRRLLRCVRPRLSAALPALPRPRAPVARTFAVSRKAGATVSGLEPLGASTVTGRRLRRTHLRLPRACRTARGRSRRAVGRRRRGPARAPRSEGPWRAPQGPPRSACSRLPPPPAGSLPPSPAERRRANRRAATDCSINAFGTGSATGGLSCGAPGRAPERHDAQIGAPRSVDPPWQAETGKPESFATERPGSAATAWTSIESSSAKASRGVH